jgi:hypothetical protein
VWDVGAKGDRSPPATIREQTQPLFMPNILIEHLRVRHNSITSADSFNPQTKKWNMVMKGKGKKVFRVNLKFSVIRNLTTSLSP